MEKSNIIQDLLDRLTKIELWKEESKGKKPPKDPAPKEDDEDVCPKCGGDLLFVEDGIVFCPKCKAYYEEEKE